MEVGETLRFKNKMNYCHFEWWRKIEMMLDFNSTIPRIKIRRPVEFLTKIEWK